MKGVAAGTGASKAIKKPPIKGKIGGGGAGRSRAAAQSKSSYMSLAIDSLMAVMAVLMAMVPKVTVYLQQLTVIFQVALIGSFSGLAFVYEFVNCQFSDIKKNFN